MLSRYRLFTICAVLLAVSVLPAIAQEKNAAQEFADVHGQWKLIDEQINELVERFRKAGGGERDKLRQQYNALAKEARSLQPKLRDAALNAYAETPNADSEIIKVLIGLASMDIFRDDYEPAAKIANLLIEKECDDKEVYRLAAMSNYCTHNFAAAERYFKLAEKSKPLNAMERNYLHKIEDSKANWKTEMALREAERKANDLPRVRLETSKGVMVLELFENEAPQSVANFIHLVESKFYNELKFHRVLPNFMSQGGCPKGDGTGGPGWNIYCECDKESYRKHFRGTLSMAHAGRNTGGSQFFITFRPTPHLDGKHTVFGRVIEGLDVLIKLQKFDPQKPAAGVEPDKIVTATVIRKREHEYTPTKVK